ncbi:hypothetical protein CYMTET_43317 [Cymbomonas tetramitiformis]|uniref:Vacuolar protein sorting-associated protein 8 central domain-containing protein n=1 Tax=Cymbomonas tetramitiformis TaxID=36881 RepID=A0AAE0C424_9CHLO|nr:hypothetical protein CYMTET_43317 [Cymbomonas tetramitiformis]
MRSISGVDELLEECSSDEEAKGCILTVDDVMLTDSDSDGEGPEVRSIPDKVQEPCPNTSTSFACQNFEGPVARIGQSDPSRNDTSSSYNPFSSMTLSEYASSSSSPPDFAPHTPTTSSFLPHLQPALAMPTKPPSPPDTDGSIESSSLSAGVLVVTATEASESEGSEGQADPTLRVEAQPAAASAELVPDDATEPSLRTSSTQPDAAAEPPAGAAPAVQLTALPEPLGIELRRVAADDVESYVAPSLPSVENDPPPQAVEQEMPVHEKMESESSEQAAGSQAVPQAAAAAEHAMPDEDLLSSGGDTSSDEDSSELLLRGLSPSLRALLSRSGPTPSTPSTPVEAVGVFEEEEETEPAGTRYPPWQEHLECLARATEAERSLVFEGLPTRSAAAGAPPEMAIPVLAATEAGLRNGAHDVTVGHGMGPAGMVHVSEPAALGAQLASSAVGMPTCLALHPTAGAAVGTSLGQVLLAPPAMLRGSPVGHTRSAQQVEPSKKLEAARLQMPAKRSVTALAFNSAGDHLITGSADGTLVLWDVLKRTSLKEIKGTHDGHPIVALAFVQLASAVGGGKSTLTGEILSADSHCTVRRHVVAKRGYMTLFRTVTNPIAKDTLIYAALPAPLPVFVKVPRHAGAGGAGDAPAPGVGESQDADVGKAYFFESSAVQNAPADTITRGLVCLVSTGRVLIVRLLPEQFMDIVARVPLPPGVSKATVPFACWKPCKRHRGQEGMELPTIAVAWGTHIVISQIQLAQVGEGADVGGGPALEVHTTMQWRSEEPVIGLQWLEEVALVAMTGRKQLLVYDVSDGGAELERVPARELPVQIPLSAGAAPGFHCAAAARGGQMLLLGPSGLQCIRLLTWRERVMALRENGDWPSAFRNALEVLIGRPRVVPGVQSAVDTEALVEAATPVLIQLLQEFLADALLGGKRSTSSPSPGSIEACAQLAVELCLLMDQTELLFREVFTRFEGIGARGTFLEALVPFVLEDRLTALAPEVMQALVEHFALQEQAARVEQCVLHMDIASLDFNQVARLCKRHRLYSALIHIFNRGLNDFVTPLLDLFDMLPDTPSAGDAGIAAGEDMQYLYKMLVYLRECFHGQCFPPGRGSLPPDQLPLLRAQLLATLLQTPAPSPGAGPVEHAYLRRLLRADAAATLAVLAEAFHGWDTTVEEMHSALTGAGSPADGEGTGAGTPADGGGTGKSACQAAAEAVMLITAEEARDVGCLERGKAKAPPTSRMAAWEYIAKFVAEGRAAVSTAQLLEMLEDFAVVVAEDADEVGDSGGMVEDVAGGVDESAERAGMSVVRTERAAGGGGRRATGRGKRCERFMIALMRAPCAEELQVAFGRGGGVGGEELERVRRLAKKGGASLVEALLHTCIIHARGSRATLKPAAGDLGWEEGVACSPRLVLLPADEPSLGGAGGVGSMWMETPLEAGRPVPQRDSEGSSAEEEDRVSGRWASVVLDEQQVRGLKEAVMAALPALTEADADATAALVVTRFADDNQRVLASLGAHPALQFQYLKGIMAAAAEARGECEGSGGSPRTSQGTGSAGLAELLQRGGMEVTEDMSELYIGLLAQFEPRSVRAFLEGGEAYHLERCLELCQRYHVADASAFLLERIGNVAEALALTLAELDTSIASLTSALGLRRQHRQSRGHRSKRPSTVEMLEASEAEVASAEASLEAAVSLCQRNTSRMEEEEGEALWLRLLDHCVGHLRRSLATAAAAPALLHDSLSPQAVASPRASHAAGGGRALRVFLTGMMEHVMVSMMGFVPTAVILRRILEHHSRDHLGDFRSTIMTVFGSYGYERTILETAKDVVDRDTHKRLQEQAVVMRRGHGPALRPGARCPVCGHHLLASASLSDTPGREAESHVDMAWATIVDDCRLYFRRDGQVVHRSCAELNAEDKPAAARGKAPGSASRSLGTPVECSTVSTSSASVSRASSTSLQNGPSRLQIFKMMEGDASKAIPSLVQSMDGRHDQNGSRNMTGPAGPRARSRRNPPGNLNNVPRGFSLPHDILPFAHDD